MSADQLAVVAALLAVAALALLAALFAARSMGRAGARLRVVDARLEGRAGMLQAQLADARVPLARVNVVAERALWTLGRLDEQLDGAAAELTAKRAASDRLRVRLEHGQTSLARVRELVRLLVRLAELRREFLQ